MKVMVIVSFVLGIIIGAIGTEYLVTTPQVRSVVCDELGPEAIRQLLGVFKP